MNRTRLSSSAVALCLAALVSACQSEPTADRPAPTAKGQVAPGGTYVALGDSYTAAPGIGPAADAEDPDACYRSQGNYPRLVARAAGLRLVDTSCSGANTESIAGSQLTLSGKRRTPQLADLGTDPDLVTLSIGGNDFALFNLIATFCPSLAAKDPSGSPCAELDEQITSGEDLEAKLDQVESRNAKALRDIRARAPRAVILVIGYPAIVPERGTCKHLGSTPGDIPLLHGLNVGLNTALRHAAAAADATYVDVYAATRGHDICSSDPWVAGSVATDGAAAPWHPYAAEQAVVAREVLSVLDRAKP